MVMASGSSPRFAPRRQSATTLEAVTAGIEAAALAFPALDLVRRRHALLQANPELHERELIKLAALARALAAALGGRGVACPTLLPKSPPRPASPFCE